MCHAYVRVHQGDQPPLEGVLKQTIGQPGLIAIACVQDTPLIYTWMKKYSNK